MAHPFKLTALGLWPFAFWPRANGRGPGVRGVLVAVAVFTLTNPQSWVAWGPVYLGQFIAYRVWQQGALSETVGGFFLPSRYLWPLELAVLLAMCYLVPRVYHRLIPAAQSPARPETAP